MDSRRCCTEQQKGAHIAFTQLQHLSNGEMIYLNQAGINFTNVCSFIKDHCVSTKCIFKPMVPMQFLFDFHSIVMILDWTKCVIKISYLIDIE